MLSLLLSWSFLQLSNVPPSSSASHSSFQLSFLFCLLLSPTLPVGILLLSTISFPHRQHSLHPSFHFAFFFPSSLCCGGAIERERGTKKEILTTRVPLSFCLSFTLRSPSFPCCGPSSNTRTCFTSLPSDEHPSLLYGWPGLSLFLPKRRHTQVCCFGPLIPPTRRMGACKS